jgi:predicted MFS family arabinose efflux permease
MSGPRASHVRQARIYALRPEARSRLNAVFMVSYFLGGAFGAALGGAGALRAAWLGLAVIGALLSLAAVIVNTSGVTNDLQSTARDETA